MQIVIKIDDILYGEFLAYGIVGLDVDKQIEISKAIRNGTLLPKGHGRLIDADALGKELHRYTEAPYLYALNQFDNAPTIVEADKEE